jgi:hypothetical protein
VVDIRHAEAERVYERKLVLVRPDGQVAWRGDTAPTDIIEWINRIRGQCAPDRAAQQSDTAAAQLAEH